MVKHSVDTRHDEAFAAVHAAFGSLGRACLALDSDFRILRASPLFDLFAGEGTVQRITGGEVQGLFGADLFGPQGRMTEPLRRGERREGWQASLKTKTGVRLVSISASPLVQSDDSPCAPGVAYIVVVRPAEDGAESAAKFGEVGLAARSQAMAQVFHLIDVLRQSDSTVIIEGESGTGKEVLARIIHRESSRSLGPFVAVSPAALPPELLESELFGHIKGAFTGAVQERVGRFEIANDGTLFLDEIGELPLHLQVKLLRVLQERSFERVGDSIPRRTNARIIAATNRQLKKEVAAGRFREDLYYRLRVVPIQVPPLRARREDIEPLARELLTQIGNRTGRSLLMSPEALRSLLSYAWPGNVREMENALEFATVVCRGQTIMPEDLPPEVGGVFAAADSTPALVPRNTQVEEERERILRALRAHGWRRGETAAVLGMSRATLWRHMRRLGVATRTA